MAALRSWSRVLNRAFLTQSRQFAAAAGHVESHQAGRMWKILTFVVALPGVGVCMLNAYLKMQHHSHGQPEFVAYPHLRIRSKPFPWGDGSKTLFHNSHVNPLPDGYEDHGDHH
ncbi:cytochrome c oxidase subunit 6A, mitochondrial [Protopterus annectens]|uniref:cytochrome c oxidase subunit 6A, mitochondrial n=1 Tax=Protopterus annectens TaxID=7888 RepID=UPI001CFB460F|nr:cytochrome c oxidase subunit 6A, mitochondrial [Protopterus annectens]